MCESKRHINRVLENPIQGFKQMKGTTEKLGKVS